MNREFIIVFSGWQSWICLFVLLLVGMTIGIFICKKNFYNEFTKAYIRSKGKSEIILSPIDIGRIKDIIFQNGTLVIVGGTVGERQGLLEQVKSYNEGNRLISTFEQLPYDMIGSISRSTEYPILMTCDDDNFVHYSSMNSTDIVVGNILSITYKEKKAIARMFVYDHGQYITMEDWIRRDI